MYEQEIPGIFGVDTRSIAKRLREHGTMAGRIVIGDSAAESSGAFYDPSKESVVAKVSRSNVTVFGDGDVDILAVDCGMKHNIIRELVNRGVRVKVVPWDHGKRIR